MIVVNNICSQAIWLTLCYFVLELRTVRLVIESKSIQEYARSLKRQRVLMPVGLIALSVIAAAQVLVFYIRQKFD